MAGVEIVHVPFKGAGIALPAVISGEVQLGFGPLLPAIPHVKAGKLKGLGVTGARRALALPDVPAIAETLPGYDVSSWYGILTPAQTPRAIVTRLNAEINAVLALPEVSERLLHQGVEVAGSSSDGLAALIRKDAAQWAKLVRTANIQIE
jgi:tripartite-type tricarboxylate transporter receptor subunit TctC